MLVNIKHDIFFFSVNDNDLNDFLHFFKSGKHQLVLNNPDDFLAFENSTWKNSLKGDDLRLILKGLKSTFYKNKISISSLSNNDEDFSLKEAYLFLQKPLQILVEHLDYDSPFFIAIIEKLDFTGKLIDAFQNGWLEFDHGGGSTIESVIRNNITRKITTSPYFIKPLEKYLRYFVIKDSDREYCIIKKDGTIIEQELIESKVRFFSEKKVPFHYLYKREKENYVPDCVFEFYLQDKVKKEFADAYLKLNNHQKDFFDLEKGFSKGEKLIKREELSSEINNLYKNISEQTYKSIGFGFANSYPSFKTRFSLEFNNVNKEQMLLRIKHQPLIKSKIDGNERNEFEHIINEIKRLL